MAVADDGDAEKETLQPHSGFYNKIGSMQIDPAQLVRVTGSPYKDYNYESQEKSREDSSALVPEDVSQTEQQTTQGDAI